MSVTSRFALGSILVALVVLALKYAAYWVTGSVALYSDALESLVNVAAALAVFIAVWLGEKPADHNHPYGHHKAEYLSAVLEGVLIVIAALTIFREAFDALTAERDMTVPTLGLVINGIAGVLNGAWASVLVVKGKALRSPALVADGKHLFTDVLSSVGVIGGLLIANYTGLTILDPVIALVIGVNILWTGWGLIRSSLSGLMDEAVSLEEQEAIRAIISANAEGALEAHALRTRHAGKLTFIDFHLVVPSDMTVTAAHDICDRIENALSEGIEGATITIHVEPDTMAEHKGIVVL